MAFDLNAIPDKQNVGEAIGLGEGQKIEFKTGVPSDGDLGRQLSAFGNSGGGWILIGVRETPLAIVGCDYARLLESFDRTIQKVKPADVATIHRVDVDDGKVIAVVVVRASSQIVTSSEGVYVREGDRLRAMSVEEIQEKLGEAEGKPDTSDLAEALATLTKTIEEMKAALPKSSGCAWRMIEFAMTFIAGTVTGVLGNLIFKWLGG